MAGEECAAQRFDQPRSGRLTEYPARPAFSTGDGYNFFLAAGNNASLSASQLSGRIAFSDSLMVHPDYDAYWQRRSIWKHEKNIKPAVLTVGGWYDGEDPYGPLRLNESLESTSAATTRTFVMGPWTHGAWNRSDVDTLGVLKFGSKTGEFFRDSIGFPFFRCTLKADCSKPVPKVQAFETRESLAHVRRLAAENGDAAEDVPGREWTTTQRAAHRRSGL